MLKDWIQTCNPQQHPECFPDLKGVPLPARLIHIGKQDSDLRLAQAGFLEASGLTYAVLSHCWGGSCPLTTTSVNIEDHFHRLPVDKLPLTFRDAIQASRALGYNYLWIDSLCIIQDSREDWAIESVKMAGIYERADICISADAALDCHTGFLGSPGRQPGPHANVSYDFSGSGHDYSGTMCVREVGLINHQLPFHGWEAGHIIRELRPLDQSFPASQVPSCLSGRKNEWVEIKSKLSTRGWVYQERMMSRRSLHFGQAETGWECRSRSTCECMPRSRVANGLKQTFAQTRWESICSISSSFNLTFATDRLPALAGLAARRIRSGYKEGSYVCGLWAAELFRDLQWRRRKGEVVCGDDQSRPEYRFADYYAPSWSWASVLQTIYIPDAGIPFKGTFDVQEVSYTPQNPANEFGPVRKGAFLRLRAYLAKVRIVNQDEPNIVQVAPQTESADYGIELETTNDSPDVKAIPFNYSGQRKDCPFADIQLDVPGELAHDPDPSLFFLLMSTPKANSSKSEDQRAEVRGLLLKYHTEGNNSSDSFQRCGHVTSSWDKALGDVWENYHELREIRIF